MGLSKNGLESQDCQLIMMIITMVMMKMTMTILKMRLINLKIRIILERLDKFRIALNQLGRA